MQQMLYDLINDYEGTLSEDSAKQYIPMLKNYFVPYLMDNFSCSNLKSLFCEEITRNGIIQAAVYYVKTNENITSKSRLIYYLNALDSIYSSILFEKYPNPNIRNIYPFTNLLDDVIKILKNDDIVLNEIEQNPPIDDEQYLFLINSLENKIDTIKAKQESIIIKLYLLYGLSSDKIGDLKVSDYSSDRNTLKIKCSIRSDISVFVELPYNLSNELNTYIKEKKFSENNKYLFSTSNGKRVNSNFISEYLKKVREKYYNTREEISKNQFTPTGLQKYAIINMIEEGMNQSVIMDFTGQKENIFNDCQNIIDERKKLNRNRYINHMIRGISVYDDM